jgi:RIO-like serine/threonine protein kinase
VLPLLPPSYHRLFPTIILPQLQPKIPVAGLRHGGTYKLLAELIKHHLVGYEKGNREGYRLTTLGYDFLALKTLSNRAVLAR